MLGRKKFEPKLMYSISLEQLVSEDNFYRKTDELLDLRFIYKECRELYGKTGNPSIDPVVFFKLSLYGYFEEIISDRELIRKASDSLSARYYLGYDIDEELPWHSTISRTRGLMKQELYEKIFNKVFGMCAEAGLVGGEHQSIDSTLVKANASLESLEKKRPALRMAEYIERTIKENKTEVKGENATEKEKREGNDEDKKGGEKSQIKIIEKPTIGQKTRRSNKYYISKSDPDSQKAWKKDRFILHYAL
jgi:transposase